MQRLGLGFTGVPFSIREMAEYAREAEDNGFESAWMAEDCFLRDGVTSLTAIALNTEKMKIGSSIFNVYMRHPALISQTCATLDEASEGRLILGIAAGVPAMINQVMKQEAPLTRVRETVHVLRELLARESITFHGKTLNLNQVELGQCPYFAPYGRFKLRRRTIPIYVAGMGPKMTRLAAEIGDGVLLSAGWSTQLVKPSVELIKEGTRKGRKDLAKLDVGCLISFSVSDDGKPDFGTQGFVACAVTQFFDEKTLQLDGISRSDVEPVRQAFEKGGFEEAAKYVTKRMIDAYSIAGTAEDCVKKLRAYVAAGVKLPIILPIGGCDVSAAIRAGKDFIRQT